MKYHGFIHKTAGYKRTYISIFLSHTHTCVQLRLYNHKPNSFVSAQGLSDLFCQCRGFSFSPPHPLLSFISHLYPCHSPFSLPTQHHPFLFFFNLHLYFTVFVAPIFLFFHPHIWSSGDSSYWLCRQNQRNGQPISFWANRVTVIHEVAQLLRCLHHCHVWICNAFPILAQFHCASTLLLGVWFIYNTLAKRER